jgi:alpha-glucoside transport system substrate-binding protein
MRHLRSRTTALALALGAGLALTASSWSGQASDASDASGRKVTIVGVWTGPEETTFKKMVLDPSKIDYTYVGGRNLDQLIRSDVQNGTPPDIAVVASPTDLSEFAQELVPLSAAVANSTALSPLWRKLAQYQGQQYGVVLKADLKGIVWYKQGALPSALNPTAPTWAQLKTLTSTSKPWCMGLGADAGSGFPGTDWISEIMLRSFGPADYSKWVEGQLEWRSTQVKQAFKTWGTILDGVRGGAASAMLTNDSTAGAAMFAPKQGCSLDSEGSFITSDYPAKSSYDFFPFPGIGADQSGPAYEVAANFAGQFNHGPQKAAATRMMAYLAGDAGQEQWQKAGDYSVDQHLQATGSTQAAKTIAGILQDRTGKNATLCFGGSDLMSSAMSAAFDQAVLTFASNQSTLPDLLKQLQAVQDSTTTRPGAVCGN